jgi:hypothetical protein
MRSELIFSAMAYVSNRYLLAMLASKAARKLHRPNTRIQETANDVFARFSGATPIADVPCAGKLQSFPCTAKAEPRSLRSDLKRSVA